MAVMSQAFHPGVLMFQLKGEIQPNHQHQMLA